MIKIIKFIFLVVIVTGFWFLITLYGGREIGTEQKIIINSGQGVNQISQSLADQGMIDSKLVFEAWLWLKRSEGAVQAGTYSLPSNISIYDLVKLLITGPDNSQISATILEGWDRNAIDKYIKEKNFNFGDFMALTSKLADWKQDYGFLADAPSAASLEGYIFPDTYFVDGSTNTNSFVIKTLNNFNSKLTDDLEAEISAQGKTIFEVVTLASIIEREVQSEEDKKMIADIFIKRLKEGIGLQSDATINFITGKGVTRPSLDDLEIESPYNTYKYRGLPPGPISNPGLSSIEAAVYPTSNPYYYFLTTEDGTVIYGRTHDEHVQNKQKYLN